MRLPVGLPFQRLPRVVAYALLAAVVSAALLAADGAYRWYRDAGVQLAEQPVAEPSAPEPSVSEAPLPERSVQAPAAEPAAAETKQAVAPSEAAPVPQPEAVGIAQPAEEKPEAVQAANPASASIPIPAARPTTGTTTAAVPEDAAPERTEPKSSQQPRRQQVRRPPAKQDTRERAAPRAPVQAARPPAQPAGPNVYYERDSQLGFAPQLRARTCNPATGQMPMQCYYPREGREQFPAKPLD